MPIKPKTVNMFINILLIIFIAACIIFIFYHDFITKEGLTPNDIENSSKCNNFDAVKKNVNIKNMNYDLYSKYRFKDVYIKTSYNSCCVGYFSNDYVDLCSLYNVLKQGVRCLDFEIRSINSKPHVTCSTNDNNYFKESYNSLDLEDVFKTINMYAFELPVLNFNDPLILHFRIKSTNVVMYENFTKTLLKHFKNKLLPENFQFENNGKNFGDTLLIDLLNSVIIIVDKSNSFYQNTDLFKYVNASTNSAKFKMLYNKDLLNLNKNQLVEYNKDNMSIILPDLTNKIYNLNGVDCFNYGIQMVGMNYQNYDDNLKNIIEYFDSNEKAFVLKPVNQLNTKHVLKVSDK